MINREGYWKHSLLLLIVILGVIIFQQSWSYISGILGACTIYVLVRNQMHYLSAKLRMKKVLAAMIILLEVVLCILVPTFLVIWLLLGKLQSVDFNPSEILATAENFLNIFHSKTGYDLVNPDNMAKVTSFITSGLQMIVGQVSSFVINSIILLFVLYFMLLGSREMEAYIYDILPFSDANKKEVIREIKMMVRSNAIGIPLLAIVQGIVAGIGYAICGVHSPALFGFLTCFATIIPIVGTSLVWFPLAFYLALSDNWISAIVLVVYALLVISNVDNVIRFMLQKKLADTHPLITVFGVILGLPLFGFWGVIFGPLLLSMFFLLVNMFKIEYLDSPKNNRIN